MNLSELTRETINRKIINVLESNQMPWQKPWCGWGKNIGFHRNVGSNRKYFGINFLLLQMSAKRHGFTSKWWGTVHDFKKFGYQVSERPPNVETGTWATEIICYAHNRYTSDIETISEVVYNSEQLTQTFEAYNPAPKLNVNYELCEKILNKVPVKLETNDSGLALYHYPPHDYITMPSQVDFMLGLTGLPGYYECLAHELIHYSETRLNFHTGYEAIRELRAEIGAAMLVQELGLPHSINFMNFRKWSTTWINFMNRDTDLIFRIAAAATKAVDFILDFSNMKEERFNELSEEAA
jgi:antirestriction protein ArdC